MRSLQKQKKDTCQGSYPTDDANLIKKPARRNEDEKKNETMMIA